MVTPRESRLRIALRTALPEQQRFAIGRCRDERMQAADGAVSTDVTATVLDGIAHRWCFEIEDVLVLLPVVEMHRYRVGFDAGHYTFI